MQHTKRLAFAVEMRSPTSGDEDDDQYGSEAQVETQEKMGSELSHKYQGPEWDGKKESYTEWRWEATPYLDSLGLESVRRGRNRSVLTTSASSKEAVTLPDLQGCGRARETYFRGFQGLAVGAQSGSASYPKIARIPSVFLGSGREAVKQLYS